LVIIKRAGSGPSKKEFFDLVQEGAFYKKEIILWPMLWKKHRTRKSDPVNRSVTPFSKGNAKNIPQAPGVYAFLVKPLIPLGLEHGVLIYVGRPIHRYAIGMLIICSKLRTHSRVVRLWLYG
jgi:hypothetical protein